MPFVNPYEALLEGCDPRDVMAVPADRWRHPFRHPECGTMTLHDLATICAGHELHHLAQLRRIDGN